MTPTDETLPPPPPSPSPSPPPPPAEDAVDDTRGPPTASSFRKFRELLMLRRFETHDNLPCRVRPGLYLGSLGAATNGPALRAAGITHVLCVSPTVPHPFPGEFVYARLEIADAPDARIRDAFPAAMAFIDAGLAPAGATTTTTTLESVACGTELVAPRDDRPRGGVLVHCFMGRSRSTTIILAYLMARHRLPLDAALATIRAVRPEAQPNRGFLAQLRAYETELGLGDGAVDRH